MFRRASSLLLCAGFYIGVALCVTTPTVILNDGNKIPVIALGTGRGTAKNNESVADVRQAVLWAIEAGYRHIDTAAIYEDEEQVGQGIADAIAKKLVTRDELFVTTKLWNDRHQPGDVVPSLRESLHKLGLSYVDLYLIHFPIATKSDGSPDTIDYLDTWEGMQEAKSSGLARSIGVSNFNSTQLDRIIANSKVKPAVNQFEVNPTLTQEPLVTHCQQQGVVVMAYSPFGFLVSRGKGVLSEKDYPIVKELAVKYNKTPGQVALRYLLQRGLIPIPKSTNQQRIAQNLDLFNFELSNEEVVAINKLNKNVRVINPVYWKDYPNYPF